MKRLRRWIAKRRLGLLCWAVLLMLLAGLAVSMERTRPNLEGESLRFSTFVNRVEQGVVQDARILNYDSYVVGRYRKRDGSLAWYRTPYFKSYGPTGGSGGINDLVDLLIDNRVAVTIDQQYAKGVAGLMTTLLPALMAVVVLLYLILSWRRGGGLFAVRSGARRHKRDDARVTFADVAGQTSAVTELREIADYLADPSRFAAVGSKIPHGVLLYGSPGSGKTLLARALAGEVGAAFYYISGAEFVELYVGVGASRVRDLFQEARQNAPAIVFIDEIDAIGQRRSAGDRPGAASGEHEQALNQILTEMDGFAGSEGVILIAATNRPDVLDPALLRPGRFDRSIGLERTDEAGRLEILRLHARGRPLAPDADLGEIAREAVGLNGAELANLVNEAGLLAARAGKQVIARAELTDALRRVREAPERQRRLAMRGSAPGRQQLSEDRITFADVAGLDHVLDEVQDIRAYLDDPERYARIGARAPKGYLLIGPPGSGKTMLVRALANEANAAFFWVAASEFVEVFVGVGASRVRDLFAEARLVAPAIVFIDEVDAIGSQRGAGLSTGGDREANTTLNQILIEMDGFSGSEGVIVVGATNRADVLDPALTRPGRFDRTITIDPPHREARRAILEVHARDKPLGPDVDLAGLAGATSGFSGADLANLLNEAALLAARRGDRQISADRVGEAMDRVVLGIAGGHRMTERDRETVAYHEAGHAIVSHALAGARLPHRVSVIPRGRTLGAVLLRETDDRMGRRSSLLEEMAADLAGHAAEELVFGETSSGTSQDLASATRIARYMVRELGMSERIGTVAYTIDRERDWRPLEYSEETARLIDTEVTRLLGEARRLARSVLERRREDLDRVAAALLERETLSAEELEELLGGERTESSAR